MQPIGDRPQSWITITNKSNKWLLFKVKTTKPVNYMVRPSLGFSAPNSEMKVQIVFNLELDDPVSSSFWWCTLNQEWFELTNSFPYFREQKKHLKKTSSRCYSQRHPMDCDLNTWKEKTSKTRWPMYGPRLTRQTSTHSSSRSSRSLFRVGEQRQLDRLIKQQLHL